MSASDYAAQYERQMAAAGGGNAAHATAPQTPAAAHTAAYYPQAATPGQQPPNAAYDYSQQRQQQQPNPSYYQQGGQQYSQGYPPYGYAQQPAYGQQPYYPQQAYGQQYGGAYAADTQQQPPQQQQQPYAYPTQQQPYPGQQPYPPQPAYTEPQQQQQQAQPPYASAYPQQQAYTQAGYSAAPPPSAPAVPSSGSAPVQYAAWRSNPPPLHSSFVAAMDNATAAAASPIGATPAAPAPAPAPSTRGPVDPIPDGTAGIQFQLGGAAARRSRWSNKDPAATALFSKTNAAAMMHAQQQTSVPQSQQFALNQIKQQQAQQSAAFSPYNPAATAAAATHKPVSNVWEYVERSLQMAPESLKPRTNDYLVQLLKDQTKIAQIQWATEPLAHLKLAPSAVESSVQAAVAKAQAAAAALSASVASGTHQMHVYSKRAQPSAPQPSHAHGAGGFTSSNNIPLGVRGHGTQAAGMTDSESKEAAAISDEEEFIPLGKGPVVNRANKRGRGAATAAAAEDKGANSSFWGKNNQQSDVPPKKAKKGHKPSKFVDAHDLAKQSDRASRFKEYNESVARSEGEAFKNPIQRHLFTAERTLDDDVELDWSALHIRGTCEVLEKRYLRLTQAPEASAVRPEHILEKSLAMVLRKWSADPASSPTAAADHLHDYKYTCEQLKSIRQDLTVQHLVSSPLTIRVYESHARIALQVGDYSEYNQCQTQLKNLYLDNPHRAEDNEQEFIGYRILYNLITNNQTALNSMIKEIQRARAEKASEANSNSKQETGNSAAAASATSASPASVKAEPLLCDVRSSTPSNPLSLAFSVSLAALQKDYFTFFRLFKSLPFMGPLILKPFVSNLRFEALTRLLRGFKPGKVDAEFMHKVLAFDTMEECMAYLHSVGCVINDGVIDCKLTELHEPDADADETAAAAHGVTHAIFSAS